MRGYKILTHSLFASSNKIEPNRRRKRGVDGKERLAT